MSLFVNLSSRLGSKNCEFHIISDSVRNIAESLASSNFPPSEPAHDIERGMKSDFPQDGNVNIFPQQRKRPPRTVQESANLSISKPSDGSRARRETVTIRTLAPVRMRNKKKHSQTKYLRAGIARKRSQDKAEAKNRCSIESHKKTAIKSMSPLKCD